jgi:cell volume regulation protein A
MSEVNQFVLIGAALLFAALALSAVSNRAGVSALVVFLGVGLFFTELPGAPSAPVQPDVAALIGNLALAVILLDGGLRTRLATLRMAARPAGLLATLGVLLTALGVGALATLLLDIDWRYGLLLGAIVGSTDAAAVFALLRAGGVRLNARVEATLEVESGLNDPMAVFLTLALIELIQQPAIAPLALVMLFVTQAGIGAVCGALLGLALSAVLVRARLGPGLNALLVQAGGLLIFATANEAGGSGFLAIYLAGVLVAHSSGEVDNDVLQASDALAWLAQASMFLILGLYAQAAQLAEVLWPALAVGVGLMLLARPLAVAVCLAPLGYPAREIFFIGWTGLRGAVPIVLALFPLLAGLPQALWLFHIAFFVVLLSLLVQGGSLPRAARWARVEVAEVPPALAITALADGAGGLQLVQIRVQPGSALVGRTVADVQWPSATRVVEAQRAGRPLVGATLDDGDLLLLSAPAAAVAELELRCAPWVASAPWVVAAATTLAELAGFYGVPLPPDASTDLTVQDYVQRKLRGRAAVGDEVPLGAVSLVVFDADAGTVRQVALRLAAKS